MDYYKCISDEYSTYKKGQIYNKSSIGRYLIEHPLDWKKVDSYPTTKELISCIETGENKNKILKTLKQWKSQS